MYSNDDESLDWATDKLLGSPITCNIEKDSGVCIDVFNNTISRFSISDTEDNITGRERVVQELSEEIQSGAMEH